MSHVNDRDIGSAAQDFPEVSFIKSALGITNQRNAILEVAGEFDLVIFLDDDFYLESNYLAVMEAVFIEDSEVVAATGTVLADGINGPGLSTEEARAIIVRTEVDSTIPVLKPVFNAYGCNMCFRMATIRAHNLRFDEELPLYAWFEDIDFSRQLAEYGRVVAISNALGVHLGAKVGRTSGLRLGYSQVANPIYLARKGTFPWPRALYSLATRCFKNLIKSVNPEPYVDRRGRLRGNIKALRALLTGTIHPKRILEL